MKEVFLVVDKAKNHLFPYKEMFKVFDKQSDAFKFARERGYGAGGWTFCTDDGFMEVGMALIHQGGDDCDIMIMKIEVQE